MKFRTRRITDRTDHSDLTDLTDLTVLTVLTVLTACSVTPLTSKIQVGEDAFVVGIGEGPDRQTDLFAAPAGGGSFTRITFTRGVERGPKLSPNGTAVAFFRRPAGATGPWSLVVLDLLTNRETSITLSQGNEPEWLGWSRAGNRVVVRSAGFLSSPASFQSLSLSRVPPDSLSWADSATSELLGDPVRGRVTRCHQDESCAVAGGDTTRLGKARDPIRWGSDSLGYFIGAAWEIRPLAGGRPRRPGWSDAPSQLREITFHPGTGTSSPP